MIFGAALFAAAAAALMFSAPPRWPRGSRPRRARRCPEPPTVGAACGAGVVLLLVGWPWGVLVAGAVFVALHRWLATLEPASQRRAVAQERADAPLAIDLLAAALEVGAPIREAVAVTGEWVGGRCGGRLDAAARGLGLGSGPAEAWAKALEGAPASLARMGSLLAAAESGGLPSVAALRDIAVDARRDAAALAEQAAQRAGIRSVAPLGACFLPAFVLVGVVPTVAGGLGHVFG